MDNKFHDLRGDVSIRSSGRVRHIAWCGPISLRPLQSWLHDADDLPEGYVFPLGAYFVEELLQRGHRVTVVTTQVGIAETQRFAGDCLDVVVLPRRSARHCARDFFRSEVRACASELRKAEPDLVHAHWTYEFADGAIRSGLPYLVTAHDSAPAVFRYMRDRYRLVRLIYSYWVVPRIRALAAPSPHIARQYARWYRRKDVTVVPNGLRDRYFESARVRNPQQRTTVVAFTGWGLLKNARTLLAGFARARQRDPALHLVVVGSGFEPGDAGYQFVRREGLAAGVEFRGTLPHEDAMQLLADEADIFVHASFEESFCMAVVEAMSAGVPVVAGRRSGAIPWLLGEGRHGILVDVHSAEDIARGVLDLARDPQHGTRIAATAREHAREHFSLSQSVAEYVSLYDQVAPARS